MNFNLQKLAEEKSVKTWAMVSQEYELAIKQCTDFISNAGYYLNGMHHHLNTREYDFQDQMSLVMKDTFSIRKSLLMEITNKWSEYNELKVLLTNIQIRRSINKTSRGNGNLENSLRLSLNIICNSNKYYK